MTAPRGTAAARDLRPALMGGAIAGSAGAVTSALADYAVAGMPADATVNALNHGVSGLVASFLAGSSAWWGTSGGPPGADDTA
ncbi:hypothetical protein [Streptomyces sp. NPDC006997]|uniref:hypothetical protein n=1 Tax=Streptomyces sp. NPDC006997 TaxID=3155356 RepID=UPI003406AD1E